MPKIAIYPGTFDPITKGHLDIIERASVLFDEVIIGIATNVQKKPFFPIEKRIACCADSVQPFSNVHVHTVEYLTVDFAKVHHAHYIIRGIRTVSDMDYEVSIANMNRALSKGELETVFFASRDAYRSFSSTIVREIISMEGDVSAFVPDCVVKALEIL